MRAKRYQNSAALHYYLRRTNPFEPVEPTEPAESFSLNQRAARPVGHTLKFESRDEWLGIRDWGLGVTGDWGLGTRD